MKKLLFLLALLPTLSFSQSVTQQGKSGTNIQWLGNYQFKDYMKMPTINGTPGLLPGTYKLGASGLMCYDSTNHVLYVNNGTSWVAVNGTPSQPYRVAPCFLLIGESGTVGQGDNNDLTTAEKSVRGNMQVWNPITNAIEPLHIGVNNSLGWDGPFGTANSALIHGWENELAHTFEQGKWYSDTGYYVKAGCGGCTAQQLLDNGYIDPEVRIHNFENALYAKGVIPQWYILSSEGINNYLRDNDTAAFRTEMITYLTRERKHLNSFAPIFFPQFIARYDAYNEAWQRIAASLPLTYVVPINRDSATLQADSMHATAAGLKFQAKEMVNYAQRYVGQRDAYIMSQTSALSGMANHISTVASGTWSTLIDTNFNCSSSVSCGGFGIASAGGSNVATTGSDSLYISANVTGATTYAVAYKTGAYTVGDSLRVTVRGVKNHSGQLQFAAGSGSATPDDFNYALTNGNNTFSFGTSTFASGHNWVYIGNGQTIMDAACTGIKVEKWNP